MSSKTFQYWKEVKKRDGTITQYAVYKKGRNIIIITDSGHEYLVHPSASSIDNEIRLVFGVEVLRTIRD
jgi:hypothetical protein